MDKNVAFTRRLLWIRFMKKIKFERRAKMTNKEQKELETVKNLLKEAYEHLEYCSFGDSWERECSEKTKA